MAAAARRVLLPWRMDAVVDLIFRHARFLRWWRYAWFAFFLLLAACNNGDGGGGGGGGGPGY